jgi:hypothetical protein
VTNVATASCLYTQNVLSARPPWREIVSVTSDVGFIVTWLIDRKYSVTLMKCYVRAHVDAVMRFQDATVMKA